MGDKDNRTESDEEYKSAYDYGRSGGFGRDLSVELVYDKDSITRKAYEEGARDREKYGRIEDDD